MRIFLDSYFKTIFKAHRRQLWILVRERKGDSDLEIIRVCAQLMFFVQNIRDGSKDPYGLGLSHFFTECLTLERNPKCHLVQPSCPNSITWPWLLRALSRKVLNISKVKTSTTPLHFSDHKAHGQGLFSMFGVFFLLKCVLLLGTQALTFKKCVRDAHCEAHRPFLDVASAVQVYVKYFGCLPFFVFFFP